MSFWSGKKVLVTGGAGFVGSHLTDMLVAAGSRVTVLVQRSTDSTKHLTSIENRIRVEVGDLLQYDHALRVTKGQDIVMNLAAIVGGIEFNVKNPATMFKDNTQLFINIIEASRVNQVERFLVTSSACVYPRLCTIPTPESEGFKEMPEPTSEGYGYAKRAQEFLGQKYAQQYGMKVAIARPYNAYGPRDNFNSGISHVIPSLIKRVVETPNGQDIEVWGDGSQTRAFLYVEDFARGLMELTEKYPMADAVNIGTDEETTIDILVKIIIRLAKKNVGIHFDTSKPSGQPRRNCDTTKAKQKLGFQARVSLQEGLQRTLDWYCNEIATTTNSAKEK